MTDIAQRPIWARRTPLDVEDAKQRTTAYVYGNLLVLAAILSVTEEDVDSNRAFWIVLGTAISTFVAHVFAEAMGRRSDRRHSRRCSIPLRWRRNRCRC